MIKREILFMAINTKGQKVQGLPLGCVENTFTDYQTMQVCDSTGYWGVQQIHPGTLCEYTGVRDKEKKRVFEGHVVFHPVYGTKVIRRGSRAENGIFEDMAAFMYEDTFAFLSGSDSDQIKIIGHIHDHFGQKGLKWEEVDE